ncbi:MAG: hypothetical protein HY584_05850 [Candidatus Omnitrophica bacterium]|nr:hypothetical protein [Candidatus Omnitrophota bacterium]
MDSKKTALNVAGVIFLLVAILHLVRSIFRVSVVIGDFSVPSSYSIVAAVVAFLLSLWMFRSLK